MRCSIALAAVVVVLAAGQFASAADKPEGGIDLFDGKGLTGWEHYLVEPDVKIADVWSVRDGLLICKGEPMGYLATKKEFTNFRLIVEWRWAPGKPAGNSGVLLRITGKPRALPKCVEAQLKSGSAGDVYGFHGFQLKGDAARSVSAEAKMIGKLSGVTKIKGNEKQPGEWNKYDIAFKGGDLTLIVNGEKVNEATGCDVVMIFLHGRGEWGNDLSRVKIHGPPKNVKKNNTTPFVIVFPQSPKGEWWQVEKLGRLLDHILATTKADAQRVYLTGLSMGGFGTWAWAAREPQRFAAAMGPLKDS